MSLPPIPHVDGDCPSCGNPTLVRNVDSLAFPDLPVDVIACCYIDCPALQVPIEMA